MKTSEIVSPMQISALQLHLEQKLRDRHWRNGDVLAMAAYLTGDDIVNILGHLASLVLGCRKNGFIDNFELDLVLQSYDDFKTNYLENIEPRGEE